MAVTLDTILAGMQPPVVYLKVGIATAAVGAMRGYNLRYANGNPGPATAPSAGINGTAVTGPGQIFRANPASGNAYLAGFDMGPSTTGTLWVIDRLWENSALVTTSITAQAITAAALPARDRTGTTEGKDVMAAMEWSATGGAGVPTVTLTYTNQDGTAGRTATLTGVATPPVGTFELFSPTATNGGVRTPTSFIQSATRTSGTMHLVLFRRLAVLPCALANIPAGIDALTGKFPRIFDSSSVEVVWFPSATTATNFMGGYAETNVVP